MKKLLTFAALFLAAFAANATTYNYKCGVTSVEYEDQSYSSKNIFKVTIKHTGKNTSDYGTNTTYNATVTFYLTSDDGTLDGTYTTEGFESIGSTYDKNYINYDNTKVKVDGYSERSLHPHEISQLVINKGAGENEFSIGECTFYATNSKFNPTNTYIYHYCYDVDDLQNPDVALKPFVFGIVTEFQTEYIHYDMKVNAMTVYREDSEYDATRYFLVLTCEGTNRTSGVTHDYSVALAIYPSSASIVGSFATQKSPTVLMAIDSYVQDLTISKKRYLANDSLSTIMISDKGNHQYSFYGGTLICADLDMNYWQVYQKERIAAVHYYHFSDNDGAGIAFGFNETTGESGLITTGIDAFVGQQPLRKVMYNGTVHIEKNGRLYNLQGAIVK